MATKPENDLLVIDGWHAPAPSTFNITFNDLDSEDTTRTMNGGFHRDVIGFNFRTIEVSWKHMSREDLKKFLEAVAHAELTVKFYDPLADKIVSIKMYVGNRKVDMYNYVIDGGLPFWKDISVSFIQTQPN